MLGVTREKVLSRNRRIENGATILWSYIENLVNDAVEKGFLEP
jgi:putative hydrolase of HD superfamily